MDLCADCEREELAQTTAEDTIEVAGRVFRARLPALQCPRCGALYFDGPSVERFDLAVAVRLAQAGEISGQVARFLRKTLALRATDLAELLGVTPETVSRWETDKTPVDRRAMGLLGAMVLDMNEGRTTTLSALRALQEPHPLEAQVHVELSPV